MIAFGIAVTDPEKYRRWAGAGVERIREPDTAVYPRVGSETLFRNYNLLLDLAAKHEDLEALVLIHQDTEIVDPDFMAKARAALADPNVGLAGCVGSSGVRSIAWWLGSVTWGSFIHRYYEHGGGDLPAMTWDTSGGIDPTCELGEVDTVDGFLMVLSPWAVRNLRFDESLGQLHGYDFDFCLQVREAGHTVITADFKAIHHHSLMLLNDEPGWVEAHMRVAEKWDGRMPHVGEAPGDWKQRARRAEAEAAARYVIAHSHVLGAQARERELLAEIEEMKTSAIWRATVPVRKVNHWRRQYQARRAGQSAS